MATSATSTEQSLTNVHDNFLALSLSFLYLSSTHSHSPYSVSLSHYDYCCRLQSSDVEWVESWETCPEGGSH